MPSTRFRRPALIAILLLAAFLRLYQLGWTEYKLDEANLSRLSLRMARGVEFPLVGLGSSTGIANLPLAPWLMAIPYAFSDSPVVATGFVAVVNVLSVAGCYLLARQWLASAFGPNAAEAGALLAALLFAAAPWAVIHSRKIWAQDLLPPFVLAWAWAGWLGFVRGRVRALIVHVIALGACIQLHYSGLWLIPVSLAWAIVFRKRAGRRALIAAAIVFGLMFAPFLIADAIGGGSNLGRLWDIVRQPAAVDGQAAHLSWLMMAGQEIHSLAGPREFQNYLDGVPGGEAGFALAGLVGALALIGGAATLADVIRAWKRRALDDRSAAALALVTWFALPILVQTRHVLPVYTHYFIIIYPAPFILVGWLCARLSGVKTGQVALLGCGVLIAALQSAQWIALQNFLASRATPGGYGVLVETSTRIASEAVGVSRELGGAEVLVYADGGNPFAHEGPSIFDVLLPPDVPRRFVDVAQATSVFPRRAAVIVFYAPGGLALPQSIIDRTAVEAVVPMRSGEADAEVRVWPGQDSAAAPCGDVVLGRWQNGVALLRAQLSGEQVELCYRVEAVAHPADYHWFNHVLDPNGNRVAQIDGAGFPSRSWRVGDVVVVRFGPLALPDGLGQPAALRVGLYTYPDIATVPTASAAGDAVTIDLNNDLPR